MEHVVATLEGAGALERQHVERLLDDAEAVVVAHRVAAERAEGAGADVEAALAEDDVVAHGDERGRQGSGLRIGRAQQVVGQPLGGLRSDAGQAREGLDEARDRRDGLAHAGRIVPEDLEPGEPQAAGHAGHLLLGRPCGRSPGHRRRRPR